MTAHPSLTKGYLFAFATLLTWTSFSLVSRLAGKSVLTAYDVLALRLITASVLLLPFLRKRLPANAWRDARLWLLVVIGNLFYCLVVYHGFMYAPASHGAILLSGTQPFLITAVAWLIVGTHPHRQRLAGLALIATGIICAAIPSFSGGSTDVLIGDALILTGSVCWSFYIVLATRWGYSAWTLTCALAIGSAILYLPVYFLFLPKELNAAPWSMIATQCFFQGAVATILAMLLYIKAISILGPERTAAFLALVPIAIGLLAVPLLGEPLTVWMLSALVLVSSGAFIASRVRTGRITQPRS